MKKMKRKMNTKNVAQLTYKQDKLNMKQITKN